MANLAIKGHPTRGKEVIEILEMLGGKNKTHIKAKDKNVAYCISEDGQMYGACTYRSKSSCVIYTLEEFLEKFPYKVGDKVSSKYLKNYEVYKMEWESVNNRVIYKLQGMGWYSADELQPYKEETMKETIKIDIPKGYEFAGVDDDKQQVVFEKIGCQYPKTYVECAKLLGCFGASHIDGYKGELLYKFQELLIFRDAYWKIAGEQMSLGKPWEPDWSNAAQRKYCIVNTEGNVLKWVQKTTNKILAFPTEEMQDAFYYNFKDLIEECKEFL